MSGKFDIRPIPTDLYILTCITKNWDLKWFLSLTVNENFELNTNICIALDKILFARLRKQRRFEFKIFEEICKIEHIIEQISKLDAGISKNLNLNIQSRCHSMSKEIWLPSLVKKWIKIKKNLFWINMRYCIYIKAI